MTRARDLADSADKDIAGTLTLDGLTVGTDNTGFGVSHSTASSTATNLTFYTTNGSVTAILEFTHSGHGLSVGDLVNVGSSSVTSWLTTWGIFDLTSIADEVEVTDTTSTTFRVNITCTSVQTSSASLGQGGSYIYYKGTTTVNSGKTVITGGNVGIGTSSPSAALTINQNGASDYIRLEGPSSGDIAGGLQLYRGSTLRASFYANPTHNLTILSEVGINFRTDNAERMRIDSSGKVGIGTTSPSSSLGAGGLHVTDRIAVGSGTAGTPALHYDGDTDTGVFFGTGVVAIGTGGSERMRINSSGYVGIGTTGPAYKTHSAINYAGNSYLTDTNVYALGITNEDTTATNAVAMAFGHGGYDYTHYIASIRKSSGAHPWGDLSIGGRPSDSGGFVDRIYLQGNTGNVGIGSNNPQSNLQVGDHTFTGSNGVYNSSRVGISNHGELTSIVNASTYNDSTYPDYGLVFIQGPSTSNYNVWSISPDGPAAGKGLNFIYGHNASNIHTTTPKVTFHGEGYVTKPYQPAFLVYKTNGTITTTSYVVFNSIDYNTGNHYSTSTGRFTAPVDGRYQFNVQGICGLSEGTTVNGDLRLMVNGASSKNRGHFNHSDRWENVSYGMVLDLNANDYVQVYFVPSSGSPELYGYDAYTNFSGYLLG